MELDKRIIEGKKPLDCFDTKDARKQFIGKKGFFGARESQFMDLDSCPKCVFDELKEVDNYAESPFMTSCNHCYRFFLPEEWVKEPEKKWRAYTIAEFQETFTVGRAVRFRRKDAPTKEHLLAFGGYYTLHDGRVSILFGIHLYTLEELFEQYEWQEFYTDEYRPFGVEE